MTTQPTVHPTTPAATSVQDGKPFATGLRAGIGFHRGMPAGTDRRPGTRFAQGAAGVRGRALIATLGLAVAAAVLPAGPASASPQAPEVETHFANPGGNPQPPEPPDPPAWGPQDPDPAGGGSIPTPGRVDAGFGGAIAGPHQAAGLALIAAAVMLALLFAVTRRHRSGSGTSR